MEKIELPITRKVLVEKFYIKNDIEDFFLFILEGCEIEPVDLLKTVFYIKNNKFLFRHDIGNKIFYVNHNLVWLTFLKWNLNFHQAQDFVADMIKIHLKITNCKVYNLIDISAGYY